MNRHSGKKFNSIAFGCRVTHAEQSSLIKKLVASGGRFSKIKPHFYIVHTCAVTGKAERQVRQKINQIRKKNPEASIIATGCAATLWQKTGKIPGNIITIPNGQQDQIIKLICPDSIENKQKDIALWPKNYFSKSGRVYIKIQDGCNRHCSYCIVPSLRGKRQSRKIDSVINEVKSLKGTVSEVVYTAITTEFFGRENRESLPVLVDRTLKETQVPRISFGSIHPLSITPDFLDWYEKMKNETRLVHFFHIPVQSLSGKILKMMRRGYTPEEMMARLNAIRKINPRIFIGTDIISGYPGETAAEFAQTYRNLEKSPVSRFHVFRFSSRPKTPAALSAEIVDPGTIVKRAAKLRKLSENKFRLFLAGLAGWETTGLVLAKPAAEQEIILGNQIPATMPPGCQLTPGTVIPVKVKGLTGNKLVAEPRL